MPAKRVQSLAQLAAAVGVTKQSVSKWAQRPDFPWRAMPRGGWPVQKVQAWRAATLRPLPGGVAGVELDVEKRARVELLIQRATTIALDREIKSGRYMRREDVERGRVEAIHGCRSRLQALPRQIAGDLVGLDEQQIETALREPLNAIAADFDPALTFRIQRSRPSRPRP